MIESALVDLDTLTALPGNPKLHAVSDIDASMDAYGFIERIVINRTTGHIVSGHGRTETLRGMRTAGKKAPANVEVRDGRWMVPVDYVDLPAEQEAAAALVLNRTVELGGWDQEALAAMLSELSENEVPIIGWSEKEVSDLLGTGFNLAPPTVEPAAPGEELREYQFRVMGADAETVDHAFAVIRGNRRDVDDSQIFVVLCRGALKAG